MERIQFARRGRSAVRSPSCREQVQQQRDYSITLSARSTSPAGTSWPIAFAALRLITNS